ncbi:Lectin-domain containing receptor kinase A4.2 [Hordeum vulgare]|nr:Lectin-domain containing receptor kinase A4.2 [Hordeum vulgare]
MVTTSPPVSCWPVRRSGPGFCLAGAVPEKRTASLLGPVRTGPPAAGPNVGSDRDRTGPDRVHPEVRPSIPGTAAHRNTLIAAVTESHSRKAILEMVDERLKGELNQWWWQMERVMVTGLTCVDPARDERPSIKDVIDLLSKHEQSPTSSRYMRDASMRPRDRFPFILTRNVALANAKVTSLAY